MFFRAIPHKSSRESDERFFVRKRWKTAGILCVFQGFTNVFLAEKIRQNPQTYLCGVAIDEKMAQRPSRRYGAYLRKMAIDGYIIQLDTTDIKRMNAALSAIGRNINQIAKRINAGGGAYKADMQEIQERLSGASFLWF